MKTKYIYLFFTLLLVISCTGKKKEIDTSDIKITIQLKRFECELFNADPSQIDDYIPMFSKKYGIFFQIFNRRIIRIGSVDDPLYPELLKKFVTDHLNFTIYERTMEVFPTLDWLKEELEASFKNYTYYFPQKPIPEIITYISRFNQSVVSDENLIGIGLDKYLGTDEELYKQLGIYSYMRKRMHKDKIVSDCMQLWAITEFEFNDSINNLITNMVYQGMVMYFVDKMLPSKPDTLKWGFSQKQMNFCKNNEKQMWTYLIENKLLFNSDKFVIDKFVRDGPFTKDFTNESPARAAVWIGFNIVSSYLKKNKTVSFQDLMHERNYQKIVNQSHYNP